MFTNPEHPFYFTISTHVFHKAQKEHHKLNSVFGFLIMIYYLEILLISWGDEKYSLRFYF